MNWQQMMAVLKLRWQISRNQARKLGALNAALMLIFAILVLSSSVIAFFVGLVGGYHYLPQLRPEHLMLVWDGLVIVFLGCWMLGVLMELQQSEMLSLSNFLHLPVTLFGAFLLNYFSIWFSFSLAFFLPLMLGMSLAEVATRGAIQLLMFPLVFGFLSMVTGVTYQFRGWLSRLMQNKRRRGTVMAIITISFVLLAQLPNAINLTFMQASRNSRQQENEARTQKQTELTKAFSEGKITIDQLNEELKKFQRPAPPSMETQALSSFRQTLPWIRFANLVMPVGWLPLGVLSLAQGHVLPALLGSLGMFLIGFGSLWSSYRATMKSYTGQDGSSTSTVARRAAAEPMDTGPLFVEREIPWISTHASSIALTTFRSLLRSQEGKMILLTPLLILGSFGGLLIFGSMRETPAFLIPAIAIGAIGTAQLSVAQFLFNAFGFDRGSFRAFILCPVSRSELLRGKNFSLIPIVGVMTVFLLIVLLFVMNLRFSHFLATLLQAAISFLLICLFGNLLSIRMPIRMSVGTLKPQTVQLGQVLVAVLSTFALPLFFLPAMSAYGLELLLEFLFGKQVIPWYLLVSILEIPIAWLVYNRVLNEQGRMLQQRETAILETVSSANE